MRTLFLAAVCIAGFGCNHSSPTQDQPSNQSPVTDSAATDSRYPLSPDSGAKIVGSLSTASAKFGSFTPPTVSLTPYKVPGKDGFFTIPVDFTYTDPHGKKWVAPANTITNGASIPRSLWSITGHPLSDKFRNAAIIHDAYSGRANVGHARHYTQPRDSTNRMFYYACRACGSSSIQAKTMYAAVVLFNHRWQPGDKTVAPAPAGELRTLTFKSAAHLIRLQDPSFTRLDAWLKRNDDKLRRDERITPADTTQI